MNATGHEATLSRKVVHLGEVAGVAGTLVSGLRSVGVDAEFKDLPAPAADSHPVVKLMRVMPRITSARHIRGDLRDQDAIAHVHYATSGLWFLGRHPLVVHCHGDDVRDPASLQRTVVNRILRSADMVIGATPDLLRWLPQGARYLPNPVDVALFGGVGPASEAPKEVLVFSVLADWKGASEMLEVVEELKRLRPQIRISAINHGSHAEAFRRAGVEMHDFMTPEKLAEFVSDHQIVIGQRLLGVAGTSELQALACARPVVMPLSDAVDPSLQPPTLSERDPQKAAQLALEMLDDVRALDAAGEKGRLWVTATHGVEAVSRRLAAWYQELV